MRLLRRATDRAASSGMPPFRADLPVWPSRAAVCPRGADLYTVPVMSKPSTIPFPGFETPSGGYPGMSLRDWFAGQALMGICAGWSQSTHPDAQESWSPTKYVGRWAYAAADAMLAARGKDE